MGSSLIVGFIFMATVIEVSPGPNFLLITRSVPTFGVPGGLANCAGFSCSYLMHGFMAIFGISAVLATEPFLIQIIQLTGAFYLLYLGVKSFKPNAKKKKKVNVNSPSVDILLAHAQTSVFSEKSREVTESSKREVAIASESHQGIDIPLEADRKHENGASLLTCFRDGFLVCILNPKITLFYMAAFPQFIQLGTDKAAGSFLLVSIHIMISAFWTILVAIILKQALSRTNSQDLVRKLDRFSGFALIGLSATFFASAAHAF